MSDHIFTAGEQKLRDTARQQLAAAGELLSEPLEASDVHEALRKVRAANSALEYLDRRAAGIPAPQRDEE